MWIIKYTTVVNFISFKEETTFHFRNGEAILIQGRNLDDQSQKSNGVGKSGLIEAVAVTFSGASIRDVLVKDLIFNGEKFATVESYLENPTFNKTLKIWRKIYANTKSAECKVWVNDKEKTDLPDINAYNKFIFETLGISKEDFFNFYLITDENGFVPFLKASDTKKKEIINRFSGADKVDLAIPFIDEDSAAKQKEIDTVGKELITVQSQMELLVNQITAEEDKLSPEKIEEQASGKKATIDNIKIEINEKGETIQNLTSEKGVKESELAVFKPTDYSVLLSTKQGEKDKLVQRLAELKIELANCKEKFKSEIDAVKEKEESVAKNKRDSYDSLKQKEELIAKDKSDKIAALKVKEDTLAAEKKETRESINEYEKFIADIDKHLAGTIECPKCSHKFLLNDKEYNITDAVENKVTAEGELAGLQVHLKDNLSLEEKAIEDEKTAINKTYLDAHSAIELEKQEVNNTFNSETEKIDAEKQSINKKVIAEQESVKELLLKNAQDTSEIDKDILDIENNKRAEDQKLQAIKNAIAQFNISIQREQQTITNLETQIKSVEREIELLLNVDRSKIDSLEEQTVVLIEKEEQLNEKLQLLTDEKKKIDEWGINFKNFKSHLANQSLNNICAYTNMYLQEMGSNISIEIEGYRLLTSKKLKEEITTTVKKDGFPVGVYGKFSRGERSRIDICTIIGIKSLVNLNSPTGGLDLTLIDEILDSVDSQGLENIVTACQRLKATCMIVSQNEINSIPKHTVTIQKENKVSKILQ